MSLIEQLTARGFDVKLFPLSASSMHRHIQITNIMGVTFYMPEYSTLDQCLARYAEKLEQFRAVKE